jgi:hypothetical protein
MHSPYSFHSMSKQCREEALRDARTGVHPFHRTSAEVNFS